MPRDSNPVPVPVTVSLNQILEAALEAEDALDAGNEQGVRERLDRIRELLAGLL
jgi:ribosome assembly protein YihI (activator of Der GTPase)